MADKNIYKYVNSFDEHRQKLESYKEDSAESFLGKSTCDAFKDDVPGIESNDFLNICHKGTYYLYTQYKTNYDIITDIACVYLYFWIYHYILKEKAIDIKKMVYINLMDASGATNMDTYQFYGKYVTEDILKKMKDLYDMYSNLNNLEDNCSSDSEFNFLNDCASSYMCYQEICKSNKDPDFCAKIEYQILPSFRKRKIYVFIIIPIVLLLIISLSLFYVSKFTKHDSWIRLLIKRIKNKFNSIDEVWDSLQTYEVSSNISRNMRCNILYNTE
ncbi:variable surface protein [Plasmodium gonderi]|uniref:Variable surface protein n=1 Tax=Plasmodium gonderi TaxID=77519 RepID=A0A1Y1JSJ9_PLAGO|nr:variable surface protein [Plasmodium gonderi]GAW84428.1 variable surface protein [Plasmodium gonderi]